MNKILRISILYILITNVLLSANFENSNIIFNKEKEATPTLKESK